MQDAVGISGIMNRRPLGRQVVDCAAQGCDATRDIHVNTEHVYTSIVKKNIFDCGLCINIGFNSNPHRFHVRPLSLFPGFQPPDGDAGAYLPV